MADSDPTPARVPAFQFYPGDFLSDRNVIAMSLPERGAYITLICLCWKEPIPADVAKLARLCGVSLGAFQRLWPALAVCFRADPAAPGFLIHPRLERERAKQEEFRQRQSDNGLKGGRPRKPTINPTESQNKAVGSSGLTQTEPNSNPEKALRSSIFDLRSSDFSQENTQSARVLPAPARDAATENAEKRPKTGMGGGSGVMGGALPREHLRHVWCGRVCVPDFLHGQFLKATGADDEALRAFYRETFDAIPEAEAVESDALKFWRPRVTARWTPAAPPAPPGQSMFAPGTSTEEIIERLTKKPSGASR